MATGNGSTTRGLMWPLLFVNLVMYVIVLGLAGWSVDKYIDGVTHHHLGGNTSTVYLLIFSLLGGCVGASSVLAGLLHVRTWRRDSLASAFSSALVAWSLTALSFGLVCKQINLGNRGRRLRTLEAFIVILTLSQLVYVMLLAAGIMSRRYGPTRYESNDYGIMVLETRKDSIITEPPNV